MNLMQKVISEDFLKSDETIADLHNQMKKYKIKIALDPDSTNLQTSKNGPKLIKSNNNFYYLNCIPKVPESRDVFYKPTSISEIHVDFDNIINSSNIEDFQKLIPTRYCFTFSTCLAPYTKASMKYPYYFIAVFDNKSTCENYFNWFNKCFKTIQEQEAEEEEKEKEIKKYKKILQIQENIEYLKKKKSVHV